MGIERDERERSPPRLSGTTPFSFQAAMPRENLLLHRVFTYVFDRSQYLSEDDIGAHTGRIKIGKGLKI